MLARHGLPNAYGYLPLTVTCYQVSQHLDWLR